MNSRYSFGYILLGIAALALFAIPLWYGYRDNLGTFRAYVPGAEMQRLADIFHRDGAQAVAAAVEAYLPSVPRDEVIVFADPDKRRLAGNLPAWPAEVPDVPGTYGLVIGLGGEASMRVVVSHQTLPGGYRLLMGRESVRFQSLVERFWYGIAGGAALVLTLGLVFAWLLRRAHGELEGLVAQRTAALRLSEERYARALQASNDGIWEWNSATDEMFMSERARELWGVPGGAAVRTRVELKKVGGFHPEDLQRTEDEVAANRAPGGPGFDIEYRVITPGGEVRWVRSQGKAFSRVDGGPAMLTGSLTDVTERKRAEEALRESEKRYERVMLAAEAGFWDWDVPADEFYVSPKLLEMTDFAPGTKFAGRADFMTRAPFHPDDRAKWERAVKEVFASGNARLAMEIRSIHGSETRWALLSGLSVGDAAGKVLRWTGSATDITARKRAEGALRVSEERYARAMEGSGAGHWDWNIVSDEMFVSERAREMLALPAGALPARRSEIMALVPMDPDDRAAMGEAVKEGIQSGIHERDYRVIPRPGEARWLRTRAKVYKDARGAAVRMTGSLIDITERKLAADALRASEERYSLAMDASAEGHFDTDLDTGEMFVSARLNEMYGFPRHAKIANRVEFLNQIPFHPDDRHLLAGIIRPDWEDPTRHLYEFECRIVPRPGEIRWIHTRGKVIRDAEGRARRRVGVVADITERKLAADELRESEGRFRALTELWSDWYWRQDESLRFTYSSAAINPPDGYPGGSAIGKMRWELPGIVPLSSSWAEHEAVLAARKPFRDFEYSRPAGDGTLRYISTSGTPIFDEQGNFKGYQGTGRNITERKRIEEELRQSEARFRSLTELSSDWYWEQDENLRFTYLSNQAAALTGYSGESSLGKTRWEIANMTPLTCSWAEHQAVLAAREPFRDLECHRVGPDGTVRYLSMSGAPIFDAQGRFGGYRGIGRNITARKAAAEAVRESEARFRALTELSSDWYWEQDENLRFTYTSRQPEETTTYPSEWVVGKARWELPGITPLSFTWPEHQAALAARQPFRDLEYARTGLDGTHYVSISGAPIFDDEGAFRGYQGIGRDITERKRIEEELRSRQEMLELAQKSAQAIAFEWRIGADGPDRNRWSPELAAMYGLGPEAYDGSFENWKKLIHPEDWPAVTEAIKHAQRTGEVSAEYRVVHPDGSTHWLHARGRMFFAAAGTPARMVGFMHDVTERRQAEEELRRLERQLRQAQRLEAMGTLAGGIAHDFNNILGAILGYGEMAQRDAPRGSRLARDLDSIVVAGERGRALVDRVLAFSRSAVGERVSVHVEKVVREALDLISAKLPPNVTLHAKLHSGPAAMLGDATQVHQMLMNLATNAIQAMPGGGTLRVSLSAARLDAPRTPTLGVMPAGDYLVLEVADGGTGISPDILDRIFDPFFTTKDVGTGTGLGLSLVHGIVTELGGAIDVASTVGAGSTFTVYLPRSGDASDSSQKEEPALPRGDGQRVLVVDDEEPLVRLATRTLEELGYVATGFTSSAAALSAFRADPQRFDALITDERMPGMSGSALIREVRGIRDRMPIVLMSGFVGGAVASRAREAGAEEVLKKPLSARDLAASLARVLHVS